MNLKKTMATYVFSVLLIIALFFAAAQQTEKATPAACALSSQMEWSKTFAGWGINEFWSLGRGALAVNEACSMIQTRDGGYAMTGSTNATSFQGQTQRQAMCLGKTDGEGNVEWTRTYGAFGYASFGHSVIQTSDGGYAIVGELNTLTGNVASGYVAYLVKTDANGNMEWNKTYAGTPLNNFFRDCDIGYSVVQTVDGGFAFAGSSVHVSEGGAWLIEKGSAWLVKTDSAGNMQWNSTFKKPGLESNFTRAGSVIQTRDGGYAMAGIANQESACLVKTDAGGKKQWEQTYHYGSAYSVIQTLDGGFAITCGDGFLVKTDAAGSIQWVKTYNSPLEGAYGGLARTSLYSAIQTSDGGYAVAGGAGGRPGIGDPSVCLVKLDSDGNMQWLKMSSDIPNDSCIGETVAQTSDGGFALAAYCVTGFYLRDACDVYLVKFANDNPIPVLSREPDGEVKPSQPVKISANCAYPASQIKSVTVVYWIDSKSEFLGGRLEMRLNPATNLYEASIPGQANGALVRFIVTANKIAGMTAAKEASYTVGQTVPQEEPPPENQSDTANLPVVYIISPENKTYLVNEVSLTFWVDKPVVWMGYSLDGQETIPVSGNATIAGLGNGPHNITVYAKDSFGTIGTSLTVAFSVAKAAEENEQFPLEWFAVPAILAVAVLAGFFYFKKQKRAPTFSAHVFRPKIS